MINSGQWKHFSLALVAATAMGLAGRAEGAEPAKAKRAVRAKTAKGEKSELPSGPGVTLTPAVFLIRDPFVLAELQLSADQNKKISELALAANEEAWKFRDLAPRAGEGSEAIQTLNEGLDASLRKLLSAAQFERLGEIVRQVQGPEAISEPKVTQALGLSGSQSARIARLCAENQAALQHLREQAKFGDNPANRDRQVGKLRTSLQRDLVTTLTPAQQERWNELLGKPIDISKLQPLFAQAPELRGVEAWINSPPLRLDGLRGQVVALHFWTFG